MSGIKLKQDVAFDLQSVSSLRSTIQNSPETGLRAVAQQMEGIFVQMMMKSMRAALPGDSMVDNDQSRLYTSLYDQQLSQDLSKKGLGFADVIVRQLGGKVTPEATEQQAKRTPESPLMLHSTAQNAINVANIDQTLHRLLSDFTPSGSNNTEKHTGPVRENASFIRQLSGPAQEVVQGSGLSHHFVLALAALESGWGKREILTQDGQPSHNLFGIKAGSNWKGKSTEITTTEYVEGVAKKVRARFRVYSSYKEAMEDYVRLLSTTPRYHSVTQAKTTEEAAVTLQQAGYASDPHYAKKLINIMQQIKDFGNKMTHEEKKAVSLYQTDLSTLF